MRKGLPVYCLAGLISVTAIAVPPRGAAEFRREIRPILETYCFDCHADGANKGNVAFDEFKTDQAAVDNRELWFKALKMLRAGLTPPAKKEHRSDKQRDQIVHWIKYEVFDLDPKNP